MASIISKHREQRRLGGYAGAKLAFLFFIQSRTSTHGMVLFTLKVVFWPQPNLETSLQSCSEANLLCGSRFHRMDNANRHMCCELICFRGPVRASGWGVEGEEG